MILLVVDTQNLITTNKLYCFDTFVVNIKKLISTARSNNIEIIYIRHDDGAGHILRKGTEGFEIYDDFRPAPDEKIFDKYVNSAFKNTGLAEYIKSKNETQLMIVGLQTEYCIDATIKSGFEHGFEIFVPEYSNSTFDNNYISAEKSYLYYNEFIWNGRYARCISMHQALKMMKKHKNTV